MHIVYRKERYSFSLVCTILKAIENFQVYVNVQKGAQWFRDILRLDVLVSSNSHLSIVII